MYKKIKFSASAMCFDWLNVKPQLEEIENLPIEKILKLEASMNTDQGVKKVELDLSDFSLEELLQMNVDTETNIEKKQK